MRIGTKLLNMALNDSRIRGYDTLSGYYRHDTSKPMADRLGPKISLRCDNWAGGKIIFELSVVDTSQYKSKEIDRSKTLISL